MGNKIQKLKDEVLEKFERDDNKHKSGGNSARPETEGAVGGDEPEVGQEGKGQGAEEAPKAEVNEKGAQQALTEASKDNDINKGF